MRSELHANPAIERIGPPAPQRDGEADEAPEQRVFVTAIEPRKSGLPIEHRDDQHFHRGGRREEAREQTEDERNPAAELDDQRRPDPGQRRIESLLHEGADIGRRPARDLAPTVHQQIPAHRDAHDRPGERDSDVVERLEAGKQQLGFVLDVLRHGLSSLVIDFNHDYELIISVVPRADAAAGHAANSVYSPPPCGEGMGWGWGSRDWRTHVATRTTPLPNPPPQGGGSAPSPLLASFTSASLPHRIFAARWMAARMR